MPELPEVHTTATILNKLLPRLTIREVWSGYNSPFHRGKKNIKDLSYFADFKKAVVGRSIQSVTRRGKNVLINLNNRTTIVIHMKMTGHLLYGKYSPLGKGAKGVVVWRALDPGPLQDPFNAHIRLVFTLSNGKHLAFSDLRKFAKVHLVPTDDVETVELAHLGPEPLEPHFNFKVFNERLNTRPRGKIKPVLMDQKVIAGIGNIYSDEMLWLSSIHPLSLVHAIPLSQRKKLFSSLKKVLSQGIDFSGDSTSDYRNPYGEPAPFQHAHRAYRRTGSPCSARGCKGTIRRLKVGGRSAHFCDKHQKLYK